MMARRIDNPTEVVTFGGYYDVGGQPHYWPNTHFLACGMQGDDFVEPVADWEPVPGAEWPGSSEVVATVDVPHPSEEVVSGNRVTWKIRRNGVEHSVTAIEGSVSDSREKVRKYWNEFWRTHETA